MLQPTQFPLALLMVHLSLTRLSKEGVCVSRRRNSWELNGAFFAPGAKTIPLKNRQTRLQYNQKYLLTLSASCYRDIWVISVITWIQHIVYNSASGRSSARLSDTLWVGARAGVATQNHQRRFYPSKSCRVHLYHRRHTTRAANSHHSTFIRAVLRFKLSGTSTCYCKYQFVLNKLALSAGIVI